MTQVTGNEGYITFQQLYNILVTNYYGIDGSFYFSDHEYMV